MQFDIDSFEDIHFRALNKLKKSPINGEFQGELSKRIDRDDFSNYCLDQKLIRLSTPSEDMDLITVKKCKDYLKEHGLHVSGNKSELINRIQHYETDFFGQQHYMLTDKGICLLRQYWSQRSRNLSPNAEMDITKKLNKYGITESEFFSFQEKLPYKYKTNDVIWGILNDRQLQYSLYKNYISLRDNYLNMAFLLEEENNKQAINYYLAVLCYDINGVNSLHEPIVVPWIADKIYYFKKYNDVAIDDLALLSIEWLEPPNHNQTSYRNIINEIFSVEKCPDFEDCKQWKDLYLSNNPESINDNSFVSNNILSNNYENGTKKTLYYLAIIIILLIFIWYLKT